MLARKISFLFVFGILSIVFTLAVAEIINARTGVSPQASGEESAIIETDVAQKPVCAEVEKEMVDVAEIIGYHDESSCGTGARGWTNASKVGIWLDWPYWIPLSEKVGEVSANQFRLDLPFNDKCHGFLWKLPDELKDVFHTLYVYALNEKGEPVKLLNRSGRDIYCGPHQIVLSVGDAIEVMKEGLQPRSGPGMEYPVPWDAFNGRPREFQRGTVFLIDGVFLDNEGNIWYEVNPGIYPDKPLKFQRMGSKKWFITADPSKVRELKIFDTELAHSYDHIPGKFTIELDRSERKQRVKKGDTVILDWSCVVVGISSGWTPLGRFVITAEDKKINRYMQGWDFDLPGVGTVAYYYWRGQAWHESYWRPNPETDYCRAGSHGCVNNPLGIGRWIYYITGDQEFDIYIHA